MQNNNAFLGLLKFQSYIMNSVKINARRDLRRDSNKWISTVFHLRTITTKDIIGEPALEGVHSDGVEHTMTTFLYSKNMTENSAISEIHYQEQKTGIPWNKTNPTFIKAKVQHRHFLDTLMIIDNELKHSVSSVMPYDKDMESIRDMLIFFTRRPKISSHPSQQYDSLKEHSEIPLRIPLL